MAENTDKKIISGILLPYNTKHFVLPSVTIAEILQVDNLERGFDMPNWVVGTMSWRQNVIFAVTLDMQPIQSSDNPLDIKRLAICQMPDINGKLMCFGAIISALPQLIKIRREDIYWQVDKNSSTDDRKVSLFGMQAIIPDFEKISKTLNALVQKNI